MTPSRSDLPPFTRPRRASHVVQWLVWLLAALLFALSLQSHLALADPLPIGPVPWWTYGATAAGLLAYATSLWREARATAGAALTVVLFAGAWSALLTGVPIDAGPPWIVREPPFSTPVAAIWHDFYFIDHSGALAVLGLYGFGPSFLAAVLLVRGLAVCRAQPPRSRNLILGVALAAFAVLGIEVGDRLARDRLTMLTAEAVVSRDWSPILSALEGLTGNPLCRAACRRGVCDLAGTAPEEVVRAAAREALGGDVRAACGFSRR